MFFAIILTLAAIFVIVAIILILKKGKVKALTRISYPKTGLKNLRQATA